MTSTTPSAGYTHVALTRELPGDLDTPVSAYLKLTQYAGRAPHTFLFESMQGGERWGRYSFIGLPSRELIRVRGRLIERLVDGAVVESRQADSPFPYIRAYADQVRVQESPGLPRFTGGLVGYFGYDCVRYIEPRLDRQHPDPIGAPDVLLMRADELAIFDNLRCTLTLVVHARAGDTADEARARNRLDALEALLQQAPRADAPTRGAPVTPEDFTSTFDPRSFGAAIERVKEYIAAGDVMQVVPSQRLSAPFTADAMTLYRTLRRLNPSPYLFCLDLGDHQVVGSSPEILVRVEDGEMTVRPIAGTRRRGATAEEDLALEADLLADPKELAEHLMLIDLGRNDVGRVAATGSVRLTDKMVIERYSHVMHIVSNVSGRLRDGMHALDALAAAFPAGTLSGAPKVRAMEIIDELEPVKRGIYGGAVGYLAWSGNLDTAIAIRTAVLKDGRIHVQAGAGIVADSDPQSEWDETMNKARAMVRAAGLATGAKR